MTGLGGARTAPPQRRRSAGRSPSEARVLRPTGTYRDALRSAHWRALKRAAARRSERRWPRRPPRCEWCRRAGGADCPLALHHRNYDRLGCERLRDVWLLCPRCHERADRRRRERQARASGMLRPDALLPSRRLDRWPNETRERTPAGRSEGTSNPGSTHRPEANLSASRDAGGRRPITAGSLVPALSPMLRRLRDRLS